MKKNIKNNSQKKTKSSTKTIMNNKSPFPKKKFSRTAKITVKRIVKGTNKKVKKRVTTTNSTNSLSTSANLARQIKPYLTKIDELKLEMSKVIVGQDKVIEGFIKALIANGHVLVEGVPGIAKTLIVRTLAVLTGCQFGRIQFTVDLLPSDIVGITTLSKDQSRYEVLKGPIFANFVIADEINRAPPKTQSALLEAMAEKQVSISKNTFTLDPPFFVMATQNPIEQGGTYPLPEAQIDRFLFKLLIGYPELHEESSIIEQNISLKTFESYELKPRMSRDDIMNMQRLVHQIKHTDRINKYIVNLVDATRKPKDYGLKLGQYISLGSSPRASIFLFVSAKADAFMKGQGYVTPQNVKNIAHEVLRHRIILNYRAQVENVTPDDVVKEILEKVRIP